MTSSGLLTTMTMASGDVFAICSDTDFTMPALVFSRSSRDMPGLRERAQSAVATREQRVLLRLVRERATHMRLEQVAGAQRSAQIHLVIAEETRAQPSVGGEANTIALPAIRVRHRRDHANRPGGAINRVVRSRSRFPRRPRRCPQLTQHIGL